MLVSTGTESSKRQIAFLLLQPETNELDRKNKGN